MCIKHNFDIPLLLAQAQIESRFGKHVRKNSVFGVISRSYTHVNNSVEDYIKIMKKSYVRTRTPEQCIAQNFNVEGSKKYRYAGSPSYGKTIGKIRTNIINSTNILELHNSVMALQNKLADLHLKRQKDEISAKNDSMKNLSV